MPPFIYAPYRAPYTGQIAQTIERQGEIPAEALQRAAAATAQGQLQSGAAYGNAIGNVSQVLAGLPGQIQRQKLMEAQTADVNAQIEERKALAAQRDQAQAGLAAVDKIMKTAMTTDPQTGVSTFDRKAFETGLAQSGQGHLYPQYAEMLDKLDASASKRNAEARGMVAQTIYGIAQHGYSPQAVLSGAAYLRANHAITDDQLAPVLGAIGTDPSPENVKATLDKITDGMPEYRQLVEAEDKRQADLKKTTAEAAKADAEQKKIAAEVAGTLPPTPAQVEAARHNKVAEQHAAADLAEKVRHDRMVEDPLGLAAAGGSSSGQPGGQVPTGEAFLKTLPQGTQTTVKALAEGRMAFPGGFALKSPYWQEMLKLVGQYDPNFDAVNYNARAKTRQDFTSGKSAAQVNALNTVLGHLDNLSDAAEALNNTSVPLVNSAFNALSKAVGRPNVTNFNTIKKAVADEVTRVWRQAGGSVEDVRTAQENLNAANSPDQLRGAIATYGELLQSKLDSLQDQYNQGLGTKGLTLLRPESQAVLEKIRSRAAGEIERVERGPDGKFHRVGGD